MLTEIAPVIETAYRQHIKTLYRFCLWRLNSTQDAEDAASEVFAKYLSGKADRVPQDQLIGWLLKTADWECKMSLRRRRRRREVGPESAPEPGREDSRSWVSLTSAQLSIVFAHAQNELFS